ncbi:hypothetical protein CRN84_24420 [Budvicia aquatica]|uniref:Uncharacterized protein n=1 Tax=Budvicia aquatica TaxID=82979 RepID=A0A2C6DPG9_9GAMM|nr:hypothetical protein CRN84_24420 [Budvicia aquatica]
MTLISWGYQCLKIRYYAVFVKSQKQLGSTVKVGQATPAIFALPATKRFNWTSSIKHIKKEINKCYQIVSFFSKFHF